MPKMKSNSGAAKRFSKTGSGKWKRNKANAQHILTKKSPKRIRGFRGTELVAASDTKALGRLIPGL
ncbi:MAG: 50S ribosomal protein L35 [Zetaproteobacteria bacterium CG_4_9_14_3_um_filter_49_83]|nr:MAG: 50S ribosomal protein L35 [Zetaproteobacteria bacterium CG1_02_49_23]PIQ30658.1 MAG: 50S ribosomal protein L35 [Zetaproteobacteria bacterium CG17_big_fil_post_rev_8_21_14_2_50_50_13]PIV31701.1 MAG: 50S ribosomal protein L35 [Zetaproteobacteria bacterium CG02_land_8_20_14_3_00_50_9]PIY55121.1 MAG: 50S ribosomal protein L35 [Zetaproteobacteria bacterium CG_4_10_14_0_8_um_filter_49_80]PJA35298.1 MAG: 50S ribosomal protein L35 [Zetaproteobacteria bacterium CG_4_9_14_3_um_filter_49_83]